MQLYALALLRGDRPPPDLGAALLAAAAAFPQLDPRTLAVGRSASGRLAYARIAHAPAVAAPRVYAACRDGALVLYDGFPVERHGRFPAHDAGRLAERWDELPDALEGVFTVVRADLRRDRVECLTDPLGQAPAFVHRGRDAVLVANSVEALRHAARLREPDRLGLASLLALGWPAGGRTLLAGAAFLGGGAVHRFDAAGERTRAHLTPATVLAAARRRPPLPAAQLLDTTRAAAAAGAPLQSALTAGRDTRVLLALSRAARADVGFYTSGPPEDLDVRIAGRLAARLGLRHRVLRPHVPAGADAWARETSAFVSRTDGLSPIAAISDHLDHDGDPERLGLELWGIAGEIGRTVKWVSVSLAAVAPLARSSHELQRRVVQRGARDPAGLIAPEALAGVRRWLDDFVAARRDEGWPPDAISNAYYAFARVRHWSARGVRRAAATTDLLSPFACRAYVEHCFGLPAAARYVEAPHRALIDAYAPEVDADPYEIAWPPRDPARALPALLGATAGRAAGRWRRGPGEPPGIGPRWLEAGLPVHRDLAASSPDSPLWDVVDRHRYRALLAGPAEARAPHAVALGRVLAALWYLEGPRPGGPRVAYDRLRWR